MGSRRGGDTDEFGSALGVAALVARRLVREDPAEVARQLAWLPHRQAEDPAALVVRAIQGHWCEPAQMREARLEEARWREQERWAADLERARVQSQAPEAQRRGRVALDQMRAMLAARGCGPVPGRVAAGGTAQALVRGCG